MNKHAYLIIIHNNFYNFEKLIQMIDDERNDIYVHVNKKVRKFDFNKYRKIVKKSKIVFSKKRFSIFWGSPLLLEAEMHLLKLAINKDEYSYFHLLSGSDLPIKSVDYIYEYFENEKKECISFSDNWNENLLRYYFVFDRILHTSHNRYVKAIFNEIESLFLNIQKKLSINRLKKLEIISKGANWFSITSNFAELCVKEYEKKYRRLFKFTILPEENFLQMVALSHKSKVLLSGEGSMRYTKWEGKDSPKTLDMSDLEDLKNSKCLFARKFDAEKNKELTDMVYSWNIQTK